MSYPDPRHLRDTGEVSATFRRSDHEPELRIGAGTAMGYLATGGSTDGKFGLHRVDMRPRTPGARAHFHRTMSESISTLAGYAVYATVDASVLQRDEAHLGLPR